MKKILIVLVLSFLLSGCSFLKIATSPFKNTVSNTPQQTEKSKLKATCSGQSTFTDDGRMLSCSKGYMNYAENYSEKERPLTFKEKVLQFINKLWGYGLWAIIISVILTFMGLGWLVSGFWSATFSVGSKAWKQVVSAIQKVKNNNPDLIQALEASTDEDVKKFINDFKQKNNIK